MLDKFKKWYRSLPDKKVYFELLGAVLTIPVLLTVILLNVSNLNGDKKNTPAPTPQVIRVVEQSPNTVTTVPAEVGGSQRVSPQQVCKREVGPVTISSPQEGQVMNSNPVCVTISYKTGEYCGVEWAVKIDNAQYSPYDSKDVCFYNISSGSHTVSVKVRGKEGGEEIILQRNFQTAGSSQPTPATTSAALTQ